MTEADAIPYEAARLRGERLLVLAPHPDDEVIGCGGLVAQHLRERRSVRVVVATDGAEQATAADREEESRRGLAVLGGSESPAIDFLRFPDRGLDDSVSVRLREILLGFRPDLIAVPSPVEIHPDHLALCRAFCDLVQRDDTLFADLAGRVAFYEVGQPLRPNAIVDISDVADAKYAAIGEHRSQLEFHDYVGYARGLNAFRAMTIPAARFAEAYYVLELRELRTTPFSALRTMTGAARELEVTRETLPISVIVRTKDRPAPLREAIASIRANEYPCEIVVVNDGGVRPQLEGVKLVHHETSRGRSEAANAGVQAAANAYVAFLDDDDLFYPEHLRTLGAAAAGPSHAAWYSDAVSAFLRPGESGGYETHSRLRLFAQDFDRELLLVDNFIPLPTLLIPRQSILEAGGFDPTFDLFEDWDLLIRLAARGDFLRVPRVTVEIRHFEGGNSIVLASREGTPEFRDAKLHIWQKHASLIGHDVFANVLERQKQRVNTLYSDLLYARGENSTASAERARLERDKSDLIAQLQSQHDTINGHVVRIRELEARVDVLNTTCAQLDVLVQHANSLLTEKDLLFRENHELRTANATTHAALESARVEIGRLNGLLNMIFGSRTWKLHTFVERLRGRG